MTPNEIKKENRMRPVRKKSYRFFYHYNKRRDGITLHFRKECIIARDIACYVPCETKWNKLQPRLVMQGFAKRVEVIKDRILIWE